VAQVAEQLPNKGKTKSATSNIKKKKKKRKKEKKKEKDNNICPTLDQHWLGILRANAFPMLLIER
jgi:hypothetical protein